MEQQDLREYMEYLYKFIISRLKKIMIIIKLHPMHVTKSEKCVDIFLMYNKINTILAT